MPTTVTPWGGKPLEQEEAEVIEDRERFQDALSEEEEVPPEDIPEPDPEDEPVATEAEDDDPESLMGEEVER